MPKCAIYPASGYAIVEIDLADDGSVLNPRILTSWPEDLYDEPSLEAVDKWVYTPRTPEETDSDRKDIVTTIRYMLRDSARNILE